MDPEETQERNCVVAYVCDITHIADIREASHSPNGRHAVVPDLLSQGITRFIRAPKCMDGVNGFVVVLRVS